MSEPMLEGTGCSMHEPYALQVLGPDMEPEFPDRCVVIVEPTEQCRDGMFVFAEVEGVRWMRQYRRDDQGREWLLALDPSFPEIELTGLDWKVLGVIIQRNIRRQIKHYEYRDAGASSTAPTTSVNAVDITRQGA
ncbi:S24 family peptidase [Halochromatium sp.]